jgi:hypothetical protein
MMSFKEQKQTKPLFDNLINNPSPNNWEGTVNVLDWKDLFSREVLEEENSDHFLISLFKELEGWGTKFHESVVYKWWKNVCNNAI